MLYPRNQCKISVARGCEAIVAAMYGHQRNAQVQKYGCDAVRASTPGLSTSSQCHALCTAVMAATPLSLCERINVLFWFTQWFVLWVAP